MAAEAAGCTQYHERKRDGGVAEAEKDSRGYSQRCGNQPIAMARFARVDISGRPFTALAATPAEAILAPVSCVFPIT